MTSPSSTPSIGLGDALLGERAHHFLITGGAGFIGSHLSSALLDAGHVVTVIDDLSTGSLDNVEALLRREEFQLVRASITDPIVLDRLASRADIVVHLAAAVGVQLILERPVHTIETNVGGTEAVLRAARRYGCRVLLASTSEVYGKGHTLPFREEDDVLLGTTQRCRWAYATSKMVDEFLAFAYAREYGLEVVPFRLFNTVGVGQSGRYGMVIPRFVTQALRGEPITVYGSGEQTRCFCDVRDIVRALIGLSFHPEAPGRVYNIGSREEVSILALAERVRQLSGSGSTIVRIPYEEAYSEGFDDLARRVPDTHRIHELLGWRPRFDLDDILSSILAATVTEPMLAVEATTSPQALEIQG